MRISMILLTGAVAVAGWCRAVEPRLGPGVHGTPPDARRAWAEGDRNRPNPPKIEAREGLPPSDAIVLVGRDRAEIDRNLSGPGNRPLAWTFSDGVLTVTKGDACTRGEWADFQLHVEWKTPPGCEKKKWGGNSGVVIHPGRRYEIQILDSSRCDPAKSPNPAPDYADGQAGAVYGQNPPMVNPARVPGEWQTFDITFHAAKWKNGQLVHPGTVSVLYNGVLVQDHWEMWERVPPPAGDKRSGKIYLQNHGYAVAFRNVWLRELPPPWANTTHGGPYVVEAEVVALREKTAVKLFAAAKEEVPPSAQRVEQMLEIVCYSSKPEYRAALEKEEHRYLEALSGMNAGSLAKQSYGVRRLKKVYDELVDKKVLESGRPLQLKCEELIKSQKFTGHVYW